MTEGLGFESRQNKEFSLLHIVQTGSGGHSVPYPMDNGGLSPQGKSCRGVNLTTSSTSVEVKKTWGCKSISPHVFIAYSLVSLEQEQLYHLPLLYLNKRFIHTECKN
jgi:hypothetical protein